MPTSGRGPSPQPTSFSSSPHAATSLGRRSRQRPRTSSSTSTFRNALLVASMGPQGVGNELSAAVELKSDTASPQPLLSMRAPPEPPAIVSAHDDGIVIVEISPDHKKYYLHKAMVVFHSEYFRKALTGLWTESKEGVVRLDDVEPGEFNIFVHWLYNQHLPLDTDFVAWRNILGKHHYRDHGKFHYQIRAYALGDRFLAPAFRRAVSSDIVKSRVSMIYIGGNLICSGFEFAFANIPSDHPILQFLVDHLCDTWRQQYNFDNTTLNNLPQAFTTRVLRRYSQLLNMSEPKRAVKSCYEEHSSEEEQNGCLKGRHMTYDAKSDFGDFTTYVDQVL